MSQGLDKEYAGITGYEDFQDAAVALAFGKGSSAVENKLVRLYMCVCMYMYYMFILYTCMYSIHIFFPMNSMQQFRLCRERVLCG